MAKHGLGRGLESLIPSYESADDDGVEQADDGAVRRARIGMATPDAASAAAAQNPGFQEIPLDQIRANPYQPRKTFRPEELAELAATIREHGVIQPIAVTRVSGGFELIAGERRTQAARLAGLKVIPAVIKERPTDQKKLELAVIENVQRTNLNPMEKAHAFKQLFEEFGMHKEEIARRAGKSLPYVINAIHLLDLPQEIQTAIEKREITEGHGKAILMIKSKERQYIAFEHVMKQKLTASQTEDLARSLNAVSATATKEQASRVGEPDPDLLVRQNELQRLLGTKVKISARARGGRIVIEYFSKEDLDALSERFRGALSV